LSCGIAAVLRREVPDRRCHGLGLVLGGEAVGIVDDDEVTLLSAFA
jgi:hypothetical protein